MTYTSNGWRSAMQGVSREIDQTFGEAVRLIPTAKAPNMQAQPQPEHAFELLGVFSWRSAMALRTDGNPVTGGKAGLVETRDPYVSFSRDALPWAPQHLDQVQRRCDGALFEIKGVEPDGVSRIVCRLVELGRSAT